MSERTGEPLLEAHGLHKSFGGTRALAGVDLEVQAGEVVCIVGPSGCGKSTLLRCINWLQPPDSGSVRLAGARVSDGGGRARGQAALNRARTRIGMVFQQFNCWPHLSVLENVALAQRVVLKRPAAEAATRAREMLTRVGLADKLAARPGQLSGGQQQRVAIARALAMEPMLMLLDEPTSALDPELVGDVLAVLRQLADDGLTMLVVTHELGFAAHVGNRLVFMDEGRIVEQGPPGELLANPQSERLQRFLDQLSDLNVYATIDGDGPSGRPN